MDISEKILKAINKGLNEALEDFDLDNLNQKDTISNDSINAKVKNIEARQLAEKYLNADYITVAKSKDIIHAFIKAHQLNGMQYIFKEDNTLFPKFINRCILTMGKEGKTLDLNWIDTSNITNMDGLFQSHGLSKRNYFNGDISEWNTSNVTSMMRMFMDSNFNGDLSKWDVSNVHFMTHMFEQSKFNNDSICNWDVSHVKNMEFMFSGKDCLFNLPIGNWNIKGANYMAGMFLNNKSFTLDLSNWILPHDDYDHKINLRSTFPEKYKPHRRYGI